VRSITLTFCIAFVVIITGCSLAPLEISDRSRRIPEKVPPVEKYQFVSPALNTTIGMAFGPMIENEIRNIMGSAVSPGSRYTLYITDLEIKDKKDKNRLVFSIKLKTHVQDEPGSETRPKFRVEVDIDAVFENTADPEKARNVAIRIAAEALVKQLP